MGSRARQARKSWLYLLAAIKRLQSRFLRILSINARKDFASMTPEQLDKMFDIPDGKQATGWKYCGGLSPIRPTTAGKRKSICA
jgi:hypothetical protein